MVRAYVDFASEMKRVNDWQLRYEGEYGPRWADQPQQPDGEGPDREEPKAEAALALLRLYAPEELYAAGRAFLDAHLNAWWGPLTGADLGVSRYYALRSDAEVAFIATAKRVLGLDSASR